jgi:hypothetical protein
MVKRGNRKSQSKSTVHSVNSHHRVALYWGGELSNVLEPEEWRPSGVLGGGRVFDGLVEDDAIALDSAQGRGEGEDEETTKEG